MLENLASCVRPTPFDAFESAGFMQRSRHSVTGEVGLELDKTGYILRLALFATKDAKPSPGEVRIEVTGFGPVVRMPTPQEIPLKLFHKRAIPRPHERLGSQCWRRAQVSTTTALAVGTA